MIFKDYYKILGLDTNRVSIEDVKNAFREQAKKYHPDLNDGTKGAEERFKDINEAYSILSDPVKKRKYDRTWNSNIGKARNKERNAKDMKYSDSIIGEAINMFFGAKKEKAKANKQNKKVQIKGENIETGINVSIKEAFFGANKKISLRSVDRNIKNIYSQDTSRN